ncbi:MAG: hypothetical protein ABI613_09825 [Gemmatimonadota bacterium]
MRREASSREPRLGYFRVGAGMLIGFLLVASTTFVLFRRNGWYLGWMAFPAITVTVVYSLSGMAIGGWFAAFLAMVRRNGELAVLISVESAAGVTATLPGMTLGELARHRESVVERLLRPGAEQQVQHNLLLRLLRSHLVHAMANDFSTDDRETSQVVSGRQLALWLAGPGISVASAAITRQLRRWQWRLLLALGVLTGLPLLLMLRFR